MANNMSHSESFDVVCAVWDDILMVCMLGAEEVLCVVQKKIFFSLIRSNFFSTTVQLRGDLRLASLASFSSFLSH